MAEKLVMDFARRFPGGPEIHCALEVPLEGPSITVLFGPSGAGKTTMLRCVAGLEHPDAGSIRHGDEVWFDGERSIRWPPQRRRIGFLHQDYALFPHLTVRENVLYGLAGAPAPARRERTDAAMAMLGIAGLASRYPHQLSGGEQQRTALARALAPRPRLLLLDEPLSALDQPTRQRIRGELRSLLVGSNVPVLLVTHDRIETLALGDRVAIVLGGAIRQVGSVEAVFAAPADSGVAAIAGVENVLPARVASCSDGMLELDVAGHRLLAVDPGEAHGEVFACIRAEEVVLATEEGGRESPRNRLRGTIRAIQPEGPLLRVLLDCGFPLAALITRPACAELALAPGKAVNALIKAPAVHVVPRGGGP